MYRSKSLAFLLKADSLSLPWLDEFFQWVGDINASFFPKQVSEYDMIIFINVASLRHHINKHSSIIPRASFHSLQLRNPSPSPLPNQPLKIDIPPIDTSVSLAGSLSDTYSSSATTTPISTPTLSFSSSVPDILIEELEQQQQLEEFQHALENQFI